MTTPDIDWKAATEAQCRRLYAAVKKLEDTGRLARLDFYERAFGPKPSLGVGFQNNFSMGRISARNAALVYDFLRRDFPEEARSVFIGHHGEAPESVEWLAFVQEHGFEDNHASDTYLKFLNVAAPDDPVEPMATPAFIDGMHHMIEVRKSYLVQYRCAVDGHAISLHLLGNDWFISSRPQPVRAGRHWLHSPYPGHAYPVCFERPDTPLLYVTIAGSAELVWDIIGSQDDRHPMREKHLSSLPGRFRAEKAPWEIVYADLFCF